MRRKKKRIYYRQFISEVKTVVLVLILAAFPLILLYSTPQHQVVQQTPEDRPIVWRIPSEIPKVSTRIETQRKPAQFSPFINDNSKGYEIIPLGDKLD